MLAGAFYFINNYALRWFYKCVKIIKEHRKEK